MTTEETTPVTPGMDAPMPTTAHGYTCSECGAPALEVHVRPLSVCAYCPDHAPAWRGWAHAVMGADLAAALGWQLTPNHSD